MNPLEAIAQAREAQIAAGIGAPEGWERAACLIPPALGHIAQDGGDGYMWIGTESWARGFKVVVSASREQDGKRWLHVSVSHKSGRVEWYDMVRVKNAFVGKEKYALQVFPPESRYVNIHDVWHLWHCLDGYPLPDFRRGTKSI